MRRPREKCWNLHLMLGIVRNKESRKYFSKLENCLKFYETKRKWKNVYDNFLVDKLKWPKQSFFHDFKKIFHWKNSLLFSITPKTSVSCSKNAQKFDHNKFSLRSKRMRSGAHWKGDTFPSPSRKCFSPILSSSLTYLCDNIEAIFALKHTNCNKNTDDRKLERETKSEL